MIPTGHDKRFGEGEGRNVAGFLVVLFTKLNFSPLTRDGESAPPTQPQTHINPLNLKLTLKPKNLREGAGWCVMSVWPSVTAVFSEWATNLFQLGGTLYTVGLVPW